MEGEISLLEARCATADRFALQDIQFGGVEGWWGLFYAKYVSIYPPGRYQALTASLQQNPQAHHYPRLPY